MEPRYLFYTNSPVKSSGVVCWEKIANYPSFKAIIKVIKSKVVPF